MSATSNPTIAISHKNPVFRQVLENNLNRLFNGYDFVHVTKLTEVPKEVNIVATQGIPDFPLARPLEIISFNAEWSADAATSNYNFAICRDETASEEDIDEVLQKHKRHMLIPKGAVKAASYAISKLDEKFESADTDENRFAILQEQLEIAMKTAGIATA